jgi:DNA-binding response OmpR family regulator
MMIVLVETRSLVAKAYVDGLDRLGVAGLHFEPEAFHDWVGNCGVGELGALEAVIVGDVEGREMLPRALIPGVSVPLIALLDKRTLEITLSLFAAGYDDVIGKPVHVQEILARINRASARRRIDVTVQEPSDLIVFADGRDPLIKGDVLVLPRRERRILECLYQGQGAWLTKSQIFNRVYGLFNDQYDESVVESHICRLRRRLKAGLEYDPVESQRYLGYRLKVLPRENVPPRPASLMQSQLDNLVVSAS